jgi:hypothetical protein
MALYVMVNLDLTEEDGHGMQVPRVGRRCVWQRIRGRRAAAHADPTTPATDRERSRDALRR